MHLTIFAPTVTICHKDRSHPFQRCISKPSSETSAGLNCTLVMGTPVLKSVYRRMLNIAV